MFGTEIFYVLCIGYGFVLAGKAVDLHRGLLELIPGFSWGNPVSVVWGALYLGILAWVLSKHRINELSKKRRLS